MDKFAEEYFQKISPLANDFKERRHELAESRIQMFAAAVYRLLTQYGEHFDIVVGSGNTGLFMTKLTEYVYNFLGMELPPVINIPVYRFQNDDKTLFDNSVLFSFVKKSLKKVEDLHSVLFVDDEIMRGITASACFKLILEALPKIDHLDATIIAENHFFQWHHKIPKLSIYFYEYSPLIQGLNGNIGHFVSKQLYNNILSIVPEVNSYNQTMALLTSGTLKSRDADGSPYFDTSIENRISKKILQYSQLKNTHLTQLKDTVIEGIKLYKSSEIAFRF